MQPMKTSPAGLRLASARRSPHAADAAGGVARAGPPGHATLAMVAAAIAGN
jgi:hypothetical protein